MDPDLNEFNQGLIGQDENTPIIDLRQYHGGMEQHEADNMATFNSSSTRRLSESSFSISSTGGVLPEVSNYEEIGSKTKVVQETLQDLHKFGKMVELVSFAPFKSAADALENANDISEGELIFFVTITIASLKLVSRGFKS